MPETEAAVSRDEDGAHGRGSTRPSEATRRALVEAAAEAFAEHGYEAASVRTITAAAGVNQGAITYHFGGKEGLYRAVLGAAREELVAEPLLSAAAIDTLPIADAVRLFMRQALAPLGGGPRTRLFLRVFAWEQLRPTDVRRSFSADNPFPTVLLAERLVRRARPDADRTTVAIATAWLIAQVATFVRDGEFLSRPPFDLALDASALDALVDPLSDLCLGGLAGVAEFTTRIGITEI